MLGRRPFAAVALLALAVAGGWWFAGRDAAPRVPGGETAADTAVAANGGDAGDGPAAARRRHNGSEAVGEIAAPDGDDVVVTARVRCLDARTGAPLPNVRVCVHFQTDEVVVVSDALGIATARGPPGMLWGYHESWDPLWCGGGAPGDPESSAIEELRLWRVPRVMVVDEAGSPCPDVHVYALTRDEKGYVYEYETRRCTTDDDGVAFLRFIAAEQAELAEESGACYAVVLDVPNTCIDCTPVDPSSHEPLRVILPPVGEVSVQVVDPSGVPLSDVAVGLDAVELESSTDPFPETTDEDGTARFRQIALGTRLRARIGTDPTHHVRAQVEFDGPGSAGVLATATIEVAGAPFVVRGRLMDGAEPPEWPQSSWELKAWLDDSWESEADGAIGSPDPEGRFELVFGGRARDQVAAAEIRLRITDGNGAEWTIDRALPPPIADGTIDLGDLRVDELPRREESIIATGRVQDEQGNPIAGASVSVVPDIGDQGDWFPRMSAASDGDGEFQLSGIRPEGRLQLHATHDSYFLPTPLDFEGVLSGVSVTMRPAAILRATFLLPEGVTWDQLDCFVEGPPARVSDPDYSPETDRLLVSPDEEGIVDVGLAPGVGSIVVTLASQSGAVLRIDDLRFEAGTECRDPRLEGIDLRGRILRRALSVRDSLGGAVGHAYAEIKPLGSEDVPVGVWVDADGRAVVPSLPGPLDVVVTDWGFRGRRLVWNGDTLQVDLQRVPPTEVRIEISNPEMLPRPPFHLLACLEWTATDQPEASPFGEEDPRGDTEIEPIGRSGGCTVTVSEPGRYRLSLIESRSGEGPWRGRPRPADCDPPEIVVTGDGEPRTVRVTLQVTLRPAER